MGEKRTVIYKLERHKWPDEIEAEKKARRRKFAVVCSCLLFFAAGFFVAKGTQGTVVSGEASAEMQKLESVYTILNEDWYFGKDIQDLSTTLLEKAISAMAFSETDLHTYYMSQEDAQNFSTSLEGTFVGIGIQFYQNAQGQYVVSAVFENSPAQKAGLQRGDLIISVMGEDCSTLSSGEIQELLALSEDETAQIVIERDGAQQTVSVKPAVVDNTVAAYVEDGYGYVVLSSFAENSGTDMQSALKRIRDAGESKIILDLRDNGGGYLSSALDIAACFLPQDTIVFQSEDRSGERTEYKVTEGYTPISFDQIVILMNENTASASEVLISALDENLGDQVIMVGNTTYGKGTMQTSVPFSDGTSLKYTTAQWFSSQGKQINGVGITPDVEVSLDEARSIGMPNYTEEISVEADSVAVIAKPVQIYLRFLGYDADRSDEYFSQASSSALAQFQRDQGLEADGVIDNETAEALVNAAGVYWNEHEEELDTQKRKAVEIIHGREAV